MTKVSLLTFFDSNNFGAGLQAYGTYMILKNKGYDVKFINYRNKYEAKYEEIFGFMKGVSLVDNLKMLVKKTIFMGSYNGKKGFRSFIKSLPQTRKYKSTKDLLEFDSYEDSDFVVVGSDQVWSPLITGGEFDLTFWGSFTNKPLISIASSAGSYTYKTEDMNLLLPYLKKFKGITVREEFLNSQLIKNGIESKVILDPTLIYGRNGWEADCELKNSVEVPEYPYLFVYLVSTKYDDCFQYIDFIKNKYDLKVVYIDKYNMKRKGVDYHFKQISPFDWIKLLKEAQYVLTDSFHGTAFSMMFHKDISIIRTNNPMRLKNLLETLNVDIPLISTLDGLRESIENRIDFSIVDDRLKIEQLNSAKSIDLILNTREA